MGKGRDMAESESASQCLLEHSYELPPTPSGVRPVARKREGSDRYVIEYEAYCVYCGEVWDSDEYSSWVDIESAAMVIEAGVDGGAFEELEDGRVVCGSDEKRSGCWKWCGCSDCGKNDGDEAKTIGIDQSDCKSKP